MSHGRPLVSVIIPNYNRSYALRLCLRSLQRQTYSPLETIVVDDCSTDDSGLVARSMDVTVVDTSVNSGAAAARNLGADHARGEILFFLDSDIALEPDAIARAVDLLRSEPDLAAVGGILEAEPLMTRSLAAQYRGLQTYHWYMPAGRPTIELHAAVLAVRAEVFAEVGQFNPDLRDVASGDFRFRITRKYEARLSGAVRGRHDHDATLRLILRKVFRRARASAGEWRRGVTPGDSTPRVLAGAALLCALPTMPLPLIVGPIGALVSPILVGMAVALDGVTYRRVLADRGILFLPYFVVVNLLVTFVGALAGGIGTIERFMRPATAIPRLSSRSG